MSDATKNHLQQIEDIRATLKLPLSRMLRRRLVVQLQILEASIPALHAMLDEEVTGNQMEDHPIIQPQGTVNVSGNAHINGAIVGINLGRIVYARDPDEEERERLVWYLARLANRLFRLPLRGMAPRLDAGQGIPLPTIYTMLAIDEPIELRLASPHLFQHYFQDGNPAQLKPEYSLDWALPSIAVTSVTSASEDKAEGAFILHQSRLAAEAVFDHPRVVLLGDTGSGKTTFLYHLAWALAQRGLDQQAGYTALPGWDEEPRLLPMMIPLRKIAERLATESASIAVVSAALCDEMTREYDVRGATHLLDGALASGNALLLLDGLEEIPQAAIPGVIVDRLTTLRVIQAFTDSYPEARIVLTCRTSAFVDTLRVSLGWPVKTIAPFTLGQIRHFIASWFTTLSERKMMTHELGAAQRATLMNAIVTDRRLRTLAESPLLLTMMAIILAEQGELHRDRPLLYERIITHVLNLSAPEKSGSNQTGHVELPHLRSDGLRLILDTLSYRAHLAPHHDDGHGRLTHKDLHYELAEFLEHQQVGNVWEAAKQYIALLTAHSGLLISEDNGITLRFTHRAIQEHCAGRYMLLAPNATRLVMQHRAEEHWRMPISLGIGVVQHLYPVSANHLDRIFTELIDPDEHGARKPLTRWYRDLILAAELGAERNWNALQELINVNRHQRDLRTGLVTILQDINQTLPIDERVRVAFLLGDLGDPRFPVTLDAWQGEINRAYVNKEHPYFCPILPHERTKKRWIARYPITNAQLQEWVRLTQTPPWRREADTNFNRPNQPAAGVTWDQCNLFCTWLSQQLGATIRLPTETEWEAAAGWPERQRYPWGDQRLRDRAATKEDHDVRKWPYTTPVGCYPAGASILGALDMIGNVWEWTADVWQSDIGETNPQPNRPNRALRGGGYLSKKKQMLITTRIGLDPGVAFDNGFRVILEISEGETQG